MSPHMKILKRSDLADWCSRDRNTIVLTNGCFDILHYGHIRHLVQASSSGTRLLVAVDTDDRVRMLKGPNRPINPLDQRMYALAALECVDGVIPFEDLPALIRVVRPTVYTKSGYRLDELDGAEYQALVAVGSQIRLIPSEPNVSTTLTLSRLHEHDSIPH